MTYFMSMPVTIVTILACVVIWLRIKRDNQFNIREDLVGKYAMIPVQVERGQWYRLLSYGFIHVEVYHIFMNMYALYNIGSFLEPMIGSIKFALILFASVIGGGLLILKGNNLTRTIGMSGGLYGLLATYFILLWKLGMFAYPSIRYSLLRTVIVNAAISFMPNVSMMGHLGGAIVGAILAFFLI